MWASKQLVLKISKPFTTLFHSSSHVTQSVLLAEVDKEFDSLKVCKILVAFSGKKAYRKQYQW